MHRITFWLSGHQNIKTPHKNGIKHPFNFDLLPNMRNGISSYSLFLNIALGQIAECSRFCLSVILPREKGNGLCRKT